MRQVNTQLLKALAGITAVCFSSAKLLDAEPFLRGVLVTAGFLPLAAMCFVCLVVLRTFPASRWSERS